MRVVMPAVPAAIPEAQVSRWRDSIRVTAVGLTTVMLPIHLIAAKPTFGLGDRFIAWLLCVIAIATIAWHVELARGALPLLPFVATQYYICYGAAQFVQEDLPLLSGHYVPPPWSITAGSALALGGLISFTGAFVLSSPRSGSAAKAWRVVPTITAKWRSGALVLATLACAEAAVANLRPELIPVEVRNILYLTANPYLALVVLLYLAYHEKLQSMRLAAWAVAVATTTFGFFSGMLEPTLVPFTTLALGRWIWGRQRPTAFIVGGLLVVVLLNPTKIVYRELLERDRSVGAFDFRERADIWIESASITWKNSFRVRENSVSVASRTSATLAFAQIVDWVPAIVPYRGYRPVLDTMLYLVPRALWSTKPSSSELIYTPYALTFGLATPQNLEHVTIGVLQPADGYWDFGVIGALLYPAMLGMVMGSLFGVHARGMRAAMGLVFIADFFQILVPAQVILASSLTVIAGALTTLWVLELFARVRVR
jgi:hypothetical protein